MRTRARKQLAAMVVDVMSIIAVNLLSNHRGGDRFVPAGAMIPIWKALIRFLNKVY
jgi:hypothetical protein